MLVLAVHSYEVSARIPFALMVLSDIESRDAIPPGLKMRLTIPTAGEKSVSLWDAPDVATLQGWLDETLSEYCTTECFEAVEDFAQGIAVELARVRVSETVAAKTGAAAATVGEKAADALSATAARAQVATKKVGQSISAMDQRLRLTEKASASYGRARETVGKAAQGVGKAAAAGREKAMKNDYVAATSAAAGKGLSTGLRWLSAGVQAIGDTVVRAAQEISEADEAAAAAAAAGDGTPGGFRSSDAKAAYEEEAARPKFFGGFDEDEAPTLQQPLEGGAGVGEAPASAAPEPEPVAPKPAPAGGDPAPPMDAATDAVAEAEGMAQQTEATPAAEVSADGAQEAA